MTQCTDRQAKQSLRALFEGSLDPEGYARLREHVAGCAACREVYERMSRVDSALEGRALPENRQALLEQELFARLAQAPQAARPPARARFTLPSFVLPSLAGLAVAAVALVVVVPRMRAPESEWGARGGTATGAWGLRAFCVGPEGRVLGEAGPGGALVCGEGDAVQFSYTAPEAARLTVEAPGPAGEPLRFFSTEGDGAPLAPGVDVPLPHSTPVQGGWLSGPLKVQARFRDAQGRALSETSLTLSPR
ncbi:anti-sigma factor family protein [Melittangium boletus]|uniref:anti-sigma factor family protein n=1 Tax=Melittangium boletus TaxID=83453 RepID=UPI003DA3EFCF